MKKLILLPILAAFVSCGGPKETENATPAKKLVCDSVEKVTIDSITGAQLFEKVEKCDSVEVAAAQ